MARPLTYRQRRGLDTRIVDGEAFVITRTTIQHLNPVATVIWLALERGSTRREVLDLLADLYPRVEPAILSTDLNRSLAMLRNIGLVTAG
jgi:hypothetical protein